MKKKALNTLALNKKSISNLENAVKGGAVQTYKECPLATGCVGPPHPTCGIVYTCTEGSDF
jgi:hypothetical protein